MMAVGPLRVPSPSNPLYGKPNQLANPSSQGERVKHEKKVPMVFFSCLNHGGRKSCPSSRVPALYVHRLENTEACLAFLERLGVDVSGVYAEDVAMGNVKSILALCRAMYVRFEGERIGDRRSPMSSWKHISPSSTFCTSLSSESTWPQFPWKQGEARRGSYLCSPAATDTRPDDGVFTVWYKEDMAVIGWIRRLLGLELADYSEFADGVLLCAIVNRLWSGSITQEDVLPSTPLERLEIAAEAAERFLGVARTELDLPAVSAGRGRDTLTRYLLGLKAASERLFQELVAMEEEKIKDRDEEETVDRMRWHIIREHSREKASVAPGDDTVRKTQATTRRPTPIVAKAAPRSPERPASAARTEGSSARAPSRIGETDRRWAPEARQEGRQDCIPEAARRIAETGRGADGARSTDQSAALKPAGCSHRILAPSARAASPGDEKVEAVEPLETSLLSLMQEARGSRSSEQGRRGGLPEKQPARGGGSGVPPEVVAPSPTTAPPPRSTTPSLTRNLPQPDVTGFFSPYSMPFVSVERRRDPAARNSSSSVVEEDSLAGGKLSSWSEKNVRESPNRHVPSTEASLPQRPPGNIDATMLARLAARSPGGLAGMSSSDSDDGGD